MSRLRSTGSQVVHNCVPNGCYEQESRMWQNSENRDTGFSKLANHISVLCSWGDSCGCRLARKQEHAGAGGAGSGMHAGVAVVGDITPARAGEC